MANKRVGIRSLAKYKPRLGQTELILDYGVVFLRGGWYNGISLPLWHVTRNTGGIQ